MNVVTNMLDVWGAAMWRASWQGSLLALAVSSICWLVPSMPARFQCWLWRLVMLKFLVALVWSLPIELPLLPAPSSATWATSEPVMLSSLPMDGVGTGAQQMPSIVTPLFVLFVAWVVVVLWQLARIIVACRHAGRLSSGCRGSEDRQLLDLLARFSQLVGLATPPQLLETEGQGSPLLVGILRPAIVLPLTTLNQLDAAERMLVIGHELAHVGRRDLLSGLVAAIIRVLFFFHPLVWLSERQLRLTQEIAADELAIALQKQNPARYASLLVSIVSKFGPGSRVPTMSVGVAGSHNSLKRRLSAMRFMRQVTTRIVIAYGMFLGLVAVSGLVPWSVVAAAAPAADKVEPQESTVSGKFVSYHDGVLKIKVQEANRKESQEIQWQIADDTKVISHIPNSAAKADSARDAFKLWEAGAAIVVKLKDDKVTLVAIGLKQGTDKVTEQKTSEKVKQQLKGGWGKFVSYKDGTLTIKANSGALVETTIPASAQTLVWSDDDAKYAPADTAAALAHAKVGTWCIVSVADENVTVRMGARKGSVIGTFVAFKDDRLLMLGKDLGESFTKKYGNNLHFNKFAAGVPVYESVDGGEYKLIGVAEKVLRSVKEGTIITVHSEGDDNATMVQIGVPNKK